MAWDELTEMWDKMQSVMRNAREEARSLLSPAHQAVALLAASKQRSEDAFLQTSVLGLARHIRPVVRGSAIILGDIRGDTGKSTTTRHTTKQFTVCCFVICCICLILPAAGSTR